MPVAVRKVMRLEIRGKDITERYETYTLADIGNAANEAVKVRNKMIALFSSVMHILHPDQAKQFLSKIPVSPTTSAVPLSS